MGNTGQTYPIPPRASVAQIPALWYRLCQVQLHDNSELWVCAGVSLKGMAAAQRSLPLIPSFVRSGNQSRYAYAKI